MDPLKWLFIALVIGAMAIAWVIVLGIPAARAADERQIRRDCTYDALRFCKAAIATADRSTIIACMIQNKDQLQAKCRRHL